MRHAANSGSYRSVQMNSSALSPCRNQAHHASGAGSPKSIPQAMASNAHVPAIWMAVAASICIYGAMAMALARWLA
jgi:hypothetical protein